MCSEHLYKKKHQHTPFLILSHTNTNTTRIDRESMSEILVFFSFSATHTKTSAGLTIIQLSGRRVVVHTREQRVPGLVSQAGFFVFVQSIRHSQNVTSHRNLTWPRLFVDSSIMWEMDNALSLLLYLYLCQTLRLVGSVSSS